VKKYLVASLLFIFHAFSQEIEKGYYMFPIKPGKQNFLTGNMGELRPGHFHAGLDIKTDMKEGLPVYAAASGYVHRIVVGERGYGKVLFMKHPNGQYTVYAHNKQFSPHIDSIVRKVQYEQKSFEVDITFKPTDLPYLKGDIIAYSGNSGSSGGPHLHFEIRDSANNYLNPLANGYTEILDTKLPFISKAALRSLHQFSRINNEFGRHELSFKKTSPQLYQSKDTTYVSAGFPFGLEINSYDLMDGIYNLQGINYISVALDDKTIFDFALEKFSREESHCIDVHVDYETLRRKGSWYHKCYVSDGNIINSYKTDNRGYITIYDTSKAHKITASVKDYNGNSSRLEFWVSAKHHELFYKTPLLKKMIAPKAKMTEQLFENILKLEYTDKDENMNLLAELYCKGQRVALTPSYTKGKFTTVYLLNLKKYLPDSITICDFVYRTNFKKMIIPRKNEVYKEGNITLDFNEKTLYDTLFLRFTNNGSTFTVNDYTLAFDEMMGIQIDNLLYLEDKLHTAAYSEVGKKRLGYAGGNWAKDSNSIYFRTKGPGTYTISRDITGPYLKITSKNARDITFKASDAGSGIGKYECFVNGEWVLMNYDYKRSLFWSEKLDKTIPFKGELLIRVYDKLGNVTEQKTNIK
jgi:hypothetical protein